MTDIPKDWLSTLGSSPTARHIAWAGEFVFAGATESDRAGRTVRFSIVRSPEARGKAHPFSAHTMRRKGFAGTRFHMSLAPMELDDPPKFGEAPIKREGALAIDDPEDVYDFRRRTRDYLGEVMLLGWTDGPKGATVTFGLPPDTPVHPFLCCSRPTKDALASRWMAVFVEISDEDTPIDQVQRAKVEAPKKVQRLSNVAAQMIKNPMFWSFIGGWAGETITESKGADRLLKHWCGIESKAALDTDATAISEFESLRANFVSWQEEQGFDPTRG